MSERVDVGSAVVILFLAAILGLRIGVQLAGPLQAYPPNPIEPEPNYTLETLRHLSPPPHYVQPSMPMRAGCSRYLIASNMYWDRTQLEACQ